MKLARNLSFVILPIAMLAACSAENKPATPATTPGSSGGTTSGGPAAGKDGGGATKTATKPQTKLAPKSVKSLAGKTPPAKATSQGKKSSPKAGKTVVPIKDVEVYLFKSDLDEDGTEDTIYWANAEGRTYVWFEGPIACSEGTEPGTGAFVAEINEDGSGAYLFSVESCPQNDLFGCEFNTDGVDTSCGACSWNESVIACVASAE